MARRIDPSNCYTSYVVTTVPRSGRGSDHRYLTAPAYSPATAVFGPRGDSSSAHLFSTFNKAASAADNIWSRSGETLETDVVPVLVERRRPAR